MSFVDSIKDSIEEKSSSKALFGSIHKDWKIWDIIEPFKV
jgi:hypothetical protein